jgi:hypothetical protein
MMTTSDTASAIRYNRGLFFAGVLLALGGGCTNVSPPLLRKADAAIGVGSGGMTVDVSTMGGNVAAGGSEGANSEIVTPRDAAVDSKGIGADASVVVIPADAPIAQLDGAGDRPVLLPAGAECSGDGDCADNACSDGICCEGACPGCSACKQTLTGEPDGICAPVASGLDPHDTCADETAVNECGNDGTCDGAGACRRVSASHVCKSALCSSGTFIPMTTCDGRGACATASPESCSPFQCSISGCFKACSTQLQCLEGYYCDVAAGTCRVKVANGKAATSSGQCTSGFLADGLCCDWPCTGICEACNSPGSLGSCVAVTTPRTPCAGSGGVCGGRCDGIQRSTCVFPDSTHACGSPASCTSNIQTSATSCAGNGTCSEAATKPCGIYGCSGTACAKSCPTGHTACETACANLQMDTKNCGACGHDCLPGASCKAGLCLPAIVLENPEPLTIFGLDSTSVYFAQHDSEADTGDVLRVAKDALRGTASPIVSGLPNPEFVGVVGPKLLWNYWDSASYSRRGASCETADCVASISYAFATDGKLIQFNTPSSQNVALYALDSAASSMTVTWYSINTTTFSKTASYSGPYDPGSSAYSFFALGDTVYWIVWPADGDVGAPAGWLYGKSASSETQKAFKLASGLSFYTFILDANPQSVFLIDIVTRLLYRVPLPLGLGTKSPQLLAPSGTKTRITAATEDANAVYWFDSDGTLYRCAWADCFNSQTVLANGQRLSASRILQDASALYWGTDSPPQIMRLAK